MNRDEIIKTLTSVFNEVLKKEDIVLFDEMTSADVDSWDSLSHMLLITEIEKEFSIKFKLRELNKLKNVGILVDLIFQKTN